MRVVGGRLSQLQIARLFGTRCLLILLANTLLAHKFSEWVHGMDHRGTLSEIMARLHQHVWMVDGRCLMRPVVNNCMICRKERQKAEEKIMSLLPDWKLEQQSPFNVIGIDFLGPLQVRGIGGHGRKTIKVLA